MGPSLRLACWVDAPPRTVDVATVCGTQSRLGKRCKRKRPPISSILEGGQFGAPAADQFELALDVTHRLMEGLASPLGGPRPAVPSRRIAARALCAAASPRSSSSEMPERRQFGSRWRRREGPARRRPGAIGAWRAERLAGRHPAWQEANCPHCKLNAAMTTEPIYAT